MFIACQKDGLTVANKRFVKDLCIGDSQVTKEKKQSVCAYCKNNERWFHMTVLMVHCNAIGGKEYACTSCKNYDRDEVLHV